MDTKKLRQKILDLAIHGKLVPQDPNDEPASVLLERIRAEKEALIKEGKIKRAKKTIASDTSHYENVPKGWSITKIEDVCIFESGYAFSSESYQKEGTPLVRISNIKEGFVDLEGCVYVDPIPDSRFIIHDGDLLIAMSGATTGKMGIYHCNRPALLNQRVGNIKTISEQILRPEYRNLYLKSLESQILKDAYGGAQPNISAKDICSYYLLLPPIEEQKRIITTVDRLMSYVDAIENGEEDCKDIITKAKEKVLELAIRGKLVPQDPTDEPASELLKRINPKAVASCDNPHYIHEYQIPNNWAWTTLGAIGKWQSGGTPSRMHKEYYGGHIPWLKTGDLNDGIITEIPERITELGIENSSAKLNPVGSILIAMYGATIGKVGILGIPATTNQACCACVDYNGIIQKYLFYFLLSHKEEFIALGGGGAQPNISKEIITKTPIPIPPMEEQLRIVEKIEKLYSQLDMIKESLQA